MPPTYRRARHEDQPHFAALLADLWEGHDYLPRQWSQWVEEPRSIFLVGELEGHPVSCGRVIELTNGAWWLEGLRVDPAYAGQGLGRDLHEALVAAVSAQPTAHEVAYSTGADNEIMQHLADATGFRRVGSYRLLRTYDEPPPEGPAPTVITGEAVPWLARLRASEWLRRSDGYLMEGWVARRLEGDFLAERIAAGDLWQYGGALALLGGGSHDDQSWVYALEGGDEAEQVALIRAAWRQRAGALRCFVPLDEALQAPLLAAGLVDAWEDDPFLCHHYVRRLG